MKLDKVSTYLDFETRNITFSLPSTTIANKKVGCGVRKAGCTGRVDGVDWLIESMELA